MDNQTVVVPHIEDNVPLPKNAREALPDLSPQEELAQEMMKNPELRPDFGTYPNETIAYLAGLVSQTSHMVAKDLADIKLTVLNRLLEEAFSAKNSRERISALKAVGEIDGVDAFKKKTEVTHINKSGEELEKELKKTIDELKGKIIHTREVVEVQDVEFEDD